MAEDNEKDEKDEKDELDGKDDLDDELKLEPADVETKSDDSDDAEKPADEAAPVSADATAASAKDEPADDEPSGKGLEDVGPVVPNFTGPTFEELDRRAAELEKRWEKTLQDRDAIDASIDKLEQQMESGEVDDLKASARLAILANKRNRLTERQNDMRSEASWIQSSRASRHQAESRARWSAVHRRYPETPVATAQKILVDQIERLRAERPGYSDQAILELATENMYARLEKNKAEASRKLSGKAQAQGPARIVPAGAVLPKPGRFPVGESDPERELIRRFSGRARSFLD